jgi:SNF2 family DNA or RNA helicase
MLREEQIDLRRQRAKAVPLAIENVGKNRVFSTYRVTNPASGGVYSVTVRGFELGDNVCTCPDYKSNTLGTCKHIEAVLETLRGEADHVKKKKANVTRAELQLDYGTSQLRLRLMLPPRHSDRLAAIALKFFHATGHWNGKNAYGELIAAIENVPEPVTVLSDAMEFIDREIERDEMTRREDELTGEMLTAGPICDLLKVPLYDYQLRGAIFLACRGRAILGDDMGLGKTVQTLSAVEILARERGIARVLVVAPASVKYQWEGEVRKFSNRSVHVVEGLKESREEQYATDCFYLLVNYEQVVRDLELINAWKPDVVVLDEAQRIKNWESKTSKAVKKLRSRYAIVLTGTPLENRLEELYSIVQFVDDRRLGPAFEFLHEHRLLDATGNLIGYRNLEKIREKLAPILLRRTRGEVLSELPPRTDSTRFVELSDLQKPAYEEQKANLARLLQKPILSELDRKRILACLSNLRLICDSLYLFDKQTHSSPKLEEFREVIADLMSSGDHKAVVFSQWETMLHEAAAVLTGLGVGHAILHGGLSGKDRKAVMQRFRDDDCRVFLSTDAGGVGLNLQAADTVINLELPWNPAVLEQRIARVHRMGQSRPVRAIHFATRGTIEERVLKAVEAKRSLFGSIFESDADEISFAAMNSTTFLDGAREAIGLMPPPPDTPVEEGALEVAEAVAPEAPASPSPEWLDAAVRLIEALSNDAAPWTPELKARLKRAAGKL